LETDLTTLAEIQSFIKEPQNLVHKSPVGILERRKGGNARNNPALQFPLILSPLGHPMRLTFFVSPYDLLNEKNKTSIPLTIENIIAKRLGQSVEVCNEASGHYKLPTSPLITITTSPNGKR
jgi:mediator of RNA polymerase II transcription subunit 1